MSVEPDGAVRIADYLDPYFEMIIWQARCDGVTPFDHQHRTAGLFVNVEVIELS